MKSFLNEEVNLSDLPAKGTGNRTEATMRISTKNLTCSEFGAIDLVVDKNNNHYFLEINPNGQWAWLEKLLDFPISKTIVDHLINH